MNKAGRDFTGVILSGGRNSRFGSNKAMAEINGVRIIDSITEKFRALFDEVIIVTNTPESYLYLNVTLTGDIYRDMGSLGGLFSGLTLAVHERVFVTACDMPFVNPAVIEYILNSSHGYDAAVAKISGHYEPLLAVYGKKLLPIMEEQIKSGSYKIIDLYSRAKIRVISEESLRVYDPGLQSFININYPEDMKRYDKKVRGQ